MQQSKVTDGDEFSLFCDQLVDLTFVTGRSVFASHFQLNVAVLPNLFKRKFQIEFLDYNNIERAG